jgi:hypothetical protein
MAEANQRYLAENSPAMQASRTRSRRNLIRPSLQPQVELWLELPKHIPLRTFRQ